MWALHLSHRQSSGSLMFQPEPCSHHGPPPSQFSRGPKALPSWASCVLCVLLWFCDGPLISSSPSSWNGAQVSPGSVDASAHRLLSVAHHHSNSSVAVRRGLPCQLTPFRSHSPQCDTVPQLWGKQKKRWWLVFPSPWEGCSRQLEVISGCP